MTNQTSWRPFLMVCFALCMGTIGTALASPLYPIYQQLWQLVPSQITAIFVAYMFGCLATLLFLGRMSNNLGYLRTLQIGIGFVILGLICSVFAHNILWLGIGRFIIGIASGLITTSAMIGLLITIPKQYQSHAPQFSSMIIAIGFGLGPLVGGIIAQFSQQPLVTPYLPIILGAFLCLIGLYYVKNPSFEKQSFSIRPRLEFPDIKYKSTFLSTGLTAFVAFGIFSLFASLAPSFIQNLIPWNGPLVSGSAIASILFISAITQFLARSRAPQKNMQLGLITLLMSVVLLAICVSMQWGILFFVSDFFVGVGHGLSLLGAFGMVHHMTHLNNRAAVVSTYLFMGYLGTIIPILSVGYLSDHFGLTTGILTFCVVIGCLSVWLFYRFKQKPQHM